MTPDQITQLRTENVNLKKVILLAPGSDEENFTEKYHKWWDTYYREIRTPGCNLLSIEQALALLPCETCNGREVVRTPEMGGGDMPCPSCK